MKKTSIGTIIVVVVLAILMLSMWTGRGSLPKAVRNVLQKWLAPAFQKDA